MPGNHSPLCNARALRPGICLPGTYPTQGLFDRRPLQRDDQFSGGSAPACVGVAMTFLLGDLNLSIRANANFCAMIVAVLTTRDQEDVADGAGNPTLIKIARS
jgi:hypothetical protein